MSLVMFVFVFCFFKQKTAYEMRISDWSSDVCSSDLVVQGPVARRMVAACRPHRLQFVTPMAAVAGAVADHLLAAMTAAADLKRAYVNDGGDIALHLALGESLACGMVAEIPDPRLNGRAVIAAETPIRGIAPSGRAPPIGRAHV